LTFVPHGSESSLLGDGATVADFASRLGSMPVRPNTEEWYRLDPKVSIGFGGLKSCEVL
jgi:hypothetical protein